MVTESMKRAYARLAVRKGVNVQKGQLLVVGAAVQDGAMFHGPCHVRINLALPRSRVEEAFLRMDEYVFNA